MSLLLWLACSSAQLCRDLSLECSPKEEEPLNYIDADGDGWLLSDDCDDTDVNVHPGVEESCNGLDDNCDGAVDEGLTSSEAGYLDLDGDGWGSGEPVQGCDLAVVSTSGDCDDADNSINPGAFEWCDGVDQDCDGEIDEAPAQDGQYWLQDEDGDKYIILRLVGEPGSCSLDGPGLTEAEALGVDCNDHDASVYPGADERCGGGDEDCDGDLDLDPIDPLTWYPDPDGDGYGLEAEALLACAPPLGAAEQPGDCDPEQAELHPGRTEQCNGWDDNCDGQVDEGFLVYPDLDGDGWGDPRGAVPGCPSMGWVLYGLDCDDADSSVHPSAPEDCASEEDRDCDGLAGRGDADGDGWPACQDCDDRDAAISPDAVERCDGGGVDEDCDGLVDDKDNPASDSQQLWWVDDDGDGYGATEGATILACAASAGWAALSGDCDDGDPSVYPGRVERCGDGVDQDCDGGAADCPPLGPEGSGPRLWSAPQPELAFGYLPCLSKEEEGPMLWSGLPGLTLMISAVDLRQALDPGAEGGVLSELAHRLSTGGVWGEELLDLNCGRDVDADGASDVAVAFAHSDGDQTYFVANVLYGPFPEEAELAELRGGGLMQPLESSPWSTLALADLLPAEGVELVSWNPADVAGDMLLLPAPEDGVFAASSAHAIEWSDGLDGELIFRGAGDMDGDGLEELVALRYTADEYMQLWLLGDLPGGQMQAEDVGSWLSTYRYYGSPAPALVPLGDMNGDGQAEVALSEPRYDGTAEGGGVVWLLGASDWASTTDLESVPRRIFPNSGLSGFGTQIVAGDTDGDALPELVILSDEMVGRSDWALVSILSGPWEGTMEADERCSAWRLEDSIDMQHQSLLMADIFGDGADDLFMVDRREADFSQLSLWPQPAL
jgi:hypothetical protein